MEIADGRVLAEERRQLVRRQPWHLELGIHHRLGRRTQTAVKEELRAGRPQVQILGAPARHRIGAQAAGAGAELDAGTDLEETQVRDRQVRTLGREAGRTGEGQSPGAPDPRGADDPDGGVVDPHLLERDRQCIVALGRRLAAEPRDVPPARVLDELQDARRGPRGP